MGKEILYLFVGSNSAAISCGELPQRLLHFPPRIFIRPIAGKKRRFPPPRMFQSAEKDAGKKKPAIPKTAKATEFRFPF